MSDKEYSEIDRDMMALLNWFETMYSPEMHKGAELKVKGLKGNVLIRMWYEE